MENLIVSVSPHIKSKNTTQKIMADVLIALVPALAAAVVFFGIGALIQTVLCVLFAGVSELLFFMVTKKRWEFKKLGAIIKDSTLLDLSFAVTGVLLALNLPVFLSEGTSQLDGIFDIAALDWGKTILYPLVGSVFAIVAVKMLFGGIGKNFANPALTARIFLLLCFGAMATATVNIFGDATTSATLLSGEKPVVFADPNFLDMFLGIKNAAAVGEVSALALLLGGGYLVARRVIDWKIPLIILASTALFVLCFNDFSGAVVLPNLLSGGLLLGAIFMATDYSTSPNTLWGTVIYSAAIGFFVALIRRFGSYPEGVSFAIVIMNIVTPLIDKYVVPRPFGRVRPVKKAAATTKTEGAAK
jgi:electron transport complex protein RnfD